MSGRIDHRAKGGLNNVGYPLRKIISEEGGLHLLECSHRLRPVSSAYVRWRRCPICVLNSPLEKLADEELLEDVDGGDVDRLLSELKARGGADCRMAYVLQHAIMGQWADDDPESCV